MNKILIKKGNGYYDYDIKNHPTIYRVKVPIRVRDRNDMIVYYGESSKKVVTWEGSVEKSINTHWK